MTYPLGNASTDFTSGIYTSDFSPAIVCGAIIDNHTPISNTGMKNSVGYQLSLVQNFVNSTYLGRVNSPVENGYITHYSGYSANIATIYGSGTFTSRYDFIDGIGQDVVNIGYIDSNSSYMYNNQRGGGYEGRWVNTSTSTGINISGHDGTYAGGEVFQLLDMTYNNIKSSLINVYQPNNDRHFEISYNNLVFGQELFMGVSGNLDIYSLGNIRMSGENIGIAAADFTLYSKGDIILTTPIDSDEIISLTSKNIALSTATDDITITATAADVNINGDQGVSIFSTGGDIVLDHGSNDTVKIQQYLELAGTLGSPPSSSNEAILWASGIGSGKHIWAQDGAGNKSRLSSHDSEGDWEYYSTNTNTGKTVIINMEKFVQHYDEQFGTSFYNVTKGK